MSLPERYPYQASLGILFLGLIFCVGCGILIGHKAVNNSGGLIINGIITLGPTGATVFYWSITIFLILVLLMLVGCLVRRFSKPQELVLEEQEMRLPYGLFLMKNANISYNSILGLSEVEISGERLLKIATMERTYDLAASLLPDKETYQRVRNLLTSKIGSDVSE